MHPALAQWSDWLRADGATDATVRTRTTGIMSLCNHAAVRDPRQISTDDIVHWLAGCESGWSRRTYWVTARRWCEWLMLTGQRDDDPSALIPRPRQPKGLPRPVSDVVIRRLLRDPPGRRAHAYVLLCLFAGLRVSEVARVRGEDLDLESRWLTVVGKGNQQAMLPLHEALVELAREMPQVGWWFPGSCSGHVAPDSVSRTVRNAMKAVGSDATAHRLRHSFGSAVLAYTHDTRITQLLLRHESLNSTQIYARVRNPDMVSAIQHLPWVA